MSVSDELAAIEAVVSEIEKDIENGTISVEAILKQIRSVTGTAAQMAKCQELAGGLMAKSKRIDIKRLKELKQHHPDDSTIGKLADRAANCYLTLFKTGCLTSEALVTPDVRAKMQSDNQNLMDMIRSQVSDLISPEGG